MFNISCGPTSIKDQIYWEKLRQLRLQLETVFNGSHPDFIHGKTLAEQELENRLFCNEVSLTIQKERIEIDYESALTTAHRDFLEKKIEMKEVLLNELEERKRQLELEYLTMDANGDVSDVKQQPKRNLRRRINEASAGNDKKFRKSSPTINMLLSEFEIDDDLNKIFANRSVKGSLSPSTLAACAINDVLGSFSAECATKRNDEKICEGNSPGRAGYSNDKDRQNLCKSQVYHMNGKLFYHKKWFLRGQPVNISTFETDRVNAIIHSISSKEVIFCLISDGGTSKKMNVPLVQLQQGRCTIRKRAV